jgi:hypothetical protein
LRLGFFLRRVNLFAGNRPVIVLVRSAKRLEGAVYLYERTVCTLPTGYLRGFDHLSGESSVIAEADSRAIVLKRAIRGLFENGRVVVVWATVNVGSGPPFRARLNETKLGNAELNSMMRSYRLKLGETLECTLSRMGARTRRNLRYYRKRAEKDISATFEPRLTSVQSDDAFTELCAHSFQPFASSFSEWRQMDGLMRTQPGYFAMGVSANGRWLSYLAGIRLGQCTYVILQINHNGYPAHSLSTVLRSYLLEEESRLGQEEINFVNGVCGLLQSSCESDVCVTLLARRGLQAMVICDWIAPRHNAPDHALNIRRWMPLPESAVSIGSCVGKQRSMAYEPW